MSGQYGDSPRINQRSINRRLLEATSDLIGRPYADASLVGSLTLSEELVLDAGVYDCVTFCETAMARALSENSDQFADNIKSLRYRCQNVSWKTRNHYFSDWRKFNSEKGYIKDVTMPQQNIIKTLSCVSGIETKTANISAMQVMDVVKIQDSMPMLISFISDNQNLDFFHCGFLLKEESGTMILRHAAKSIGAVADEELNKFIRRAGVRFVTVDCITVPL